MMSKVWKCMEARNQVVPGAAAPPWKACEVCVEESIDVCRYDGDGASDANGSFFHAVLNMSGMLIGLGQLSVPYALETAGWSSVFFLLFLSGICAYTSHLLGQCLHKRPKSQSYADIAAAAFGARGRAIAAAFIYLSIFMALVGYTISLHDNLTTVFSHTHLHLLGGGGAGLLSSSQLLTGFAVLVALPSLWLRDLSSISFLSTGGILMSLVIFASVVAMAVFGIVKADGRIPVLQVQKVPAISGLYLFSFAGHTVFPNLYKAMKDPSKFTKVSIVSFASVTTLYTALAFTGAKLFGPQVNPQITLSLPRHHFITKIALWATVLTPMTKYALEFAPFAIQLERSLPASMPARTKMAVRGCVGSLLLVLILVLALSVPYFEHVLGLTGSLVSVGICVVLPCVFYVKISWTQMSRASLALNVSLIAFGVLIGVLGTVSSAKSLIISLLRGHHPAV